MASRALPFKVAASLNTNWRFSRRVRGSRTFCSQGHKVKEAEKDDLTARANNLISGLRKGDRAALAAGITLVETEHPRKRILAQEVLDRILREGRGGGRKNGSLRIGLSGPPGAGKSSFIEVFGKFLTGMGKRVAVLAVDPSSAATGGSLLGDKTRMPELTRDMMAYIRPSPTRGHLGGVTRSTNEAIVLCEFAGFEVIIVETVGVGQSEYAVSNMVDIFVLLVPPGGGDELQGVKRGIVERADLLLVTKCDGDLKSAAQRTEYEYRSSLKFMRPTNPNWKTKVLGVSAKTKEGLGAFWEAVQAFEKANAESLEEKRAEQRVIWTWTHVTDGLHEFIQRDVVLKERTDLLIKQVQEGSLTPGAAADKIIHWFTQSIREGQGEGS